MEEGQVNGEGVELDLGSVSKAMILMGGIFLFTFLCIYIFASFSESESAWENVWFQPGSSMFIVPTLSFIVLVVGIILFIIHFQFVKLGDVAMELEEEYWPKD